MVNRRIATITALGGALLVLPAVWNTAPFLYFDSSSYFSRGAAVFAHLLPSGAGVGDVTAAAAATDGKPVITGRSAYYGVLAYLGLVLGDLWPVAVLQGLTLAWLVATLFRVATPLRWEMPSLLTLAGLAAFTPAGIFAGMVMPDIWVGLMVLAVALLCVAWSRLSHVERGGCLIVVAFSALAHASHLLLLTVGLALLTVLHLARASPSPTSRPALLGIAGCLLVGVVGAVAFAVAVERVSGAPPISRPHLTAQLVDDGPGVEFLRKTCPESGYALCEYRDRLPAGWITFLFGTDPTKGFFGSAPDEVQRALADEQLHFTLDVLRDAPLRTVALFTGDALAQIGRFGVRDLPLTQSSETYLETHFPQDVVEMTKGTRVYHNPEILAALTKVTYVIFYLSLVSLAALALRGGWKVSGRLSPDLIAIVAICVGGVLLNALICGALASPYDRFQARIVWILPMLAALSASALLQERTRTKGAELKP